MANTVSEYFSDDDLETQIRLQFEEDEMWDMDFKTIFSQITDNESFFELKLRNRIFHIDKITGSVSEVNVNE